MSGIDVFDQMNKIENPPMFSQIFGEDSEHARRLSQHVLWLQNIRRERPSPTKHYKVGIYIRYFNQTKYENYLEYHQKQFADTIALCPNWNLVGFYIDYGGTAPNMESAREWSRLLDDCMDGKVDLIITQKISNVSKKSNEMTLCARMLALQKPPIGIYFISEDVFTLASYYMEDMRDLDPFVEQEHQAFPEEPDRGVSMIDDNKRKERERQKEKVRKRIQVVIDEENYRYIPAKKQVDYYDNEVHQRVAVYVRVSTDDVRQTTSYELQKKYYEDFVVRHPNWTLVKIYADEGISGTSLAHRDEFNQMIADCKAGKIDMIITKSVSRFARNVVICIGIVRDLAELKPPIGVFFESEAIFSLNEDSQMALSFQATMAEEESHTRSRSMEASLRMRLDNGIPLTPKLLGYTHAAEGNLVINPEEAPTVKLAFYMYLYGYSTQQIADALIALERKSYLGNIKWTSGSVLQILRNERHCGDICTRKTYTPNFRDHKSKKNEGQRPQSWYYNHHPAIISRDDFNAVQRMLDNAKYGNKTILPELRVIDNGILKGFVTINPRWAGFKEAEYYQAAKSVYPEAKESDGTEEMQTTPQEVQVEVEAGDFDLRGFEITRCEFFDTLHQPRVTFGDRRIKFSTECVRKYGLHNHVELLINPIERKFAVRATNAKNRNAVVISKISNRVAYPKEIPAAAFYSTVFSLFGWNTDYKYRIVGSRYEQGDETVYIFDVEDSEAYVKSYVLSRQETSEEGVAKIQPFMPSGKRIRAIPEKWTTSFGKQFYLHEQDIQTLEQQSEEDWNLRLEGRLFETGNKLNVTAFSELRQYIKQALVPVAREEHASNE